MTDASSQAIDNQPSHAAEEKKLTYWRVVEPGLLHGVSLIVFLLGGYWAVNAFNESILGFLGVIMLLWAGFKSLVLLAIYGFAVFAILFRPHWFTNTVERRLMRRLKSRMDRDIETGHIQRAMDRAHGMLCRYPHHIALRRRLASLLIADDRLEEAGRHLIYLPRLTKTEQRAVAFFYEAQGHDPFQILRKSLKGLRLAGLSPWDDRELLLAALPAGHPLHEEAKNYDPDDFYKNWVNEPDTLPRSALQTMQTLHRAIDRDNEMRSRLYGNLPVYFRYKDRSRLKAFLQTNRNTIIEIAVGLALSALFFMLPKP